jgi:UDP-N-acetylmuramyl pentapeptide phosphotransferase/UDP-N-acetylglucosamine-1-phosphate transferase
MGDAGSLFLGYVLAYLAIKYQMYNDGSVFIYREESLLISITLLFIPCIDVIRVALSRKIQGKRMFDADKTHIHHVLMQRGLSMRMTLAVIISLFVFISATNYLLYDFIPSTLIIIIDIIIYALFIYINKRQTK